MREISVEALPRQARAAVELNSGTWQKSDVSR